MAHRGNRVACPENTLAAFRRALDDGADIIETDLHVTADGEFVCIHDATVDRTTDGRGPVAGMTLGHVASKRPRLSALLAHVGLLRVSPMTPTAPPPERRSAFSAQ